MPLAFRPIAEASEREACYDLWAEAFTEGRDFFQRRLAGDREDRPENTWVAVVDGVVRSAIQVFPYHARYGASTVRVGGIGSVGTAPAFRGRGLSRQLLSYVSGHLDQSGTHLSLLFTGIPRFYEAVGFHTVAAGVRAFVRPRLHPGVEAVAPRTARRLFPTLYEKANRDVPMTRIRTDHYWDDWPSWAGQDTVRFMARRGGVPAAYAIVRRRAGRASLLDLAVDREAADLGVRVLETALHGDRRERIPVALPAGHPLLDRLESGPGLAETMWRLGDPARALKRLQPELSRRARQQGLGAFALGIRVGQARVRIGGDGRDGVTARPWAVGEPVDQAVTVDRAKLLRWILEGMSPEPAGLPASAGERLAALFLPAAPFVWPLDEF